jgi:hypothetical protein
VIPESPKGLSVVRHAHHSALGHELPSGLSLRVEDGPNGATSKGNLDSRFRGNDRNVSLSEVEGLIRRNECDCLELVFVFHLTLNVGC